MTENTEPRAQPIELRVTSPVPASQSVDVERNGRIGCPVCGFPIGAVRGSKAAICGNCGFKDGCC
jgi:hypothetical protein